MYFYNHYADVIGRVVACDDFDNYDKNGRVGKKKPLTLTDVEYVILILYPLFKLLYKNSKCGF